MFKTHKSFNVNNNGIKCSAVEKKDKRPEEKCHWIRYLFIPGICLLVILLIVPNIHSKEYYEKSHHAYIAVHNANITNKSFPINLNVNVKKIFKDPLLFARAGISEYEAGDTTPKCSVNDDCEVNCLSVNADLESLAPYFETCKTIESLNITDGKFPSSTIPNKWLDSSNLLIRNVFLHDCDIDYIEKNAFSSEVFSILENIWINGSSIEEISKEAFGLRNLDNCNKSLKIINNKASYFSWTPFIGYMQYVIEEFIVNNPYLASEVQSTIFSYVFEFASLYPQLKKIDLSYNPLNLSMTTFNLFPILENLFLKNCSITQIPEKAFVNKNYQTIKVINLQNNKLRSISVDILNKFLSSKNFEMFYISGNPWDCGGSNSIDVFYKFYPDKFEQGVLCGNGSLMAGEEIVVTTTPSTTSTINEGNKSTPIITPDPITTPETSTTTTPVTTTPKGPLPTPKSTPDLEGTPETSTPPISPTPITTTPVTTTPKDPLPTPQSTPDLEETTVGTPGREVMIHCPYQLFDQSYNQDIIIDEKAGEFHFETVNLRSVKVIISRIPLGYSLIWFHLKGPKDKSPIVQSGLGNSICDCEVSVLIEGLSPKAVYTFCLIGHSQTETSPLNCRSYYTGDEGADIWLTKDAKAAGIAILIFGLFLTFVIGSLIMYFIIRRFPKLAKGKRVIVSNDGRSSVLILPRKSCQRSIRNPTSRRKSDVSIGSGKTYCIPDILDSEQYEMIREIVYFDAFPTTSPPPLPKRLSRQSTIRQDDLENNYLKTIDENEPTNF